MEWIGMVLTNWSYYKTVLNYNVWDTTYLQTVFGHIQSSAKRISVSQETQLQDSYNLNTFSGPGRNAYKNIFVLQKPVSQQKKYLQNEALQNAL